MNSRPNAHRRIPAHLRGFRGQNETEQRIDMAPNKAELRRKADTNLNENRSLEEIQEQYQERF